MKINKICSSLIKPATPTPPNLENFQISFWDSQQRPANILVVLFFESKPESESGSDRHLKMEESLAETLVQFYPLAGRFIKELNSVDCSDQGVEFIQAEAPDLDLVSVIGADHHNHLIPDHYFHLHESTSQPLLSVQATSFTCGGTAVAVSVSHRVFDVSSLATFLSAWSSTAKLGKTAAAPLGPIFDLPSLLPVKNTDSFNFAVANPTTRENAAVMKLHFDGAALLRLKSKIGKAVSAGRAAAAAIAKALILLDAAKRGGGGKCRGFRIFQAVNMRERTTAPVAKHACGNFSFLSGSRRVDAPEAESISLPELSALIGETVRRCIVDYAGIVSPDGDGREIIIRNREKMKSSADTDTDTNTLVFTDWSKFGFYDVDFRWGKAVGASTLPPQTRNYYVALMSNREGDGIEAWLRFNRSDMHRFNQDCEFVDQLIYDLSN